MALKSTSLFLLMVGFFSGLVAFTSGGRAATVEESFSLTNPSVALGVSASPTTGSVTDFNPALGTLTQVVLTYNLKAVITTQLTNMEPFSESDVMVSLTGYLQLDMPAGSPRPVQNFSHSSEINTLAGGGSGTLTSTLTFSVQTQTFTTDLDFFEGAGVWDYTLVGFLATAVSSNPDVVITSSSVVASLESGTATYTYSAVPEPAVAGLLALGVGVVLVARRGARSV